MGNSIRMHHYYLLEFNNNSTTVKTKNHLVKTIKQKSNFFQIRFASCLRPRAVISRVGREWSPNLRDFTSRHACSEVKFCKFWLHRNNDEVSFQSFKFTKTNTLDESKSQIFGIFIKNTLALDYFASHVDQRADFRCIQGAYIYRAVQRQ